MEPAARMLDWHICGLPHPIPGPFLPPCCPTVLIEKRPAARIGDPIFCFPPPPLVDLAVKAKWMIWIGGRPATYMGAECAHNRGVVIMGSPTVLLGG